RGARGPWAGGGGAGVRNFPTPEACADAIAAALARQSPQPMRVRSAAPPAGGGVLVDEFASGATLDRLGIPSVPSVTFDIAIDRAPAPPFPYPLPVNALRAQLAPK